MSVPLCTYCGAIADTMDHVPPRIWLERAPLLGIEVRRAQTVPSCRECNCAIGAKMLLTIAERAKCAKDHIRRKYAKHLRMPDWSEAELADVGPNMQREIGLSLRIRDRARERLRWIPTRTGVADPLSIAETFIVGRVAA